MIVIKCMVGSLAGHFIGFDERGICFRVHLSCAWAFTSRESAAEVLRIYAHIGHLDKSKYSILDYSLCCSPL